jgi:hypothetical protein
MVQSVQRGRRTRGEHADSTPGYGGSHRNTGNGRHRAEGTAPRRQNPYGGAHRTARGEVSNARQGLWHTSGSRDTLGAWLRRNFRIPR